MKTEQTEVLFMDKDTFDKKDDESPPIGHLFIFPKWNSSGKSFTVSLRESAMVYRTIGDFPKLEHAQLFADSLINLDLDSLMRLGAKP